MEKPLYFEVLVEPEVNDIDRHELNTISDYHYYHNLYFEKHLIFDQFIHILALIDFMLVRIQ